MLAKNFSVSMALVDYIPVISVINQLTMKQREEREILSKQRSELEERLGLLERFW